MTTVYIVHCVDTEGPLREQPMGLHYQAPTPAAEDLPLDIEEAVRVHRSRTLGRWEDVMSMVARATAPGFRRDWVYNWFCMDHIGFIENPRGRAMGIHAIFDVYKSIVEEQGAGDSIHWHFHPMSTYREADRCATSYLNSPELWEILSRRLIDRGWFPKANRSGFQDQRPDSHWFLEQYIPFDFSNLAGVPIDFTLNRDLADGRFSDWRGAPDDWSTYHPHHDDYRKRGQCRRKIARCLNVLNRFANLEQSDMDRAFGRAAGGEPTLVSFASHDWRDLATEVAYVRRLVSNSQARYPGVEVRVAEAVEAFNAVHPPIVQPPLDLRVEVTRDVHGAPLRLDITTVDGAVFGPQPFLAVKSRSARYIHDNLNRGVSDGQWWYAFDADSIRPEDVAAWSIAANDAAGRQSILRSH